MGIHSIKIKNILSFDNLVINDLADINCIIGKNNVGKSNVLKVIKFFYECLAGTTSLPPKLFNAYSTYGEITIVYNTSRVEEVVRSKKGKSPYQKHIYNSLFESELKEWWVTSGRSNKNYYSISLRINKDNSISWSEKNKKVREVLTRIYPFLYIDTRRIDLYDWKDVWEMVSKLKFLNTNNLSRDDLVNYIDSNISGKSNSYREYVNSIRKVTRAAAYNYQDLILNYIKVGLDGQTFNINGYDLITQSDGANSYQFLEVFLSLTIILTRREFITPIVFIDEPEIGLHPKRSEELIQKLHDIYRGFKNDGQFRQDGKYKNPFPVMIFTTHSPNILKTVIKSFNHPHEHSIFHFSSTKDQQTISNKMNSQFEDARFLNVFSDNEARLFFSNFILFVEGETELELFGNYLLKMIYPFLNNIDVYRTNEVYLKAINPSRSNVAVPYLVLYDADKMIDIDLSDGKVIFKKKEVDLFSYRDKYKSSYWGSKKYYHKMALDAVLSLSGKKFKMSASKMDFERLDIERVIARVNRVLNDCESIYVASNTIEGLLINNDSRNIFIEWLICEFVKNTNITSKGDANILINRFLNSSSPIDIERCFNAIYSRSTTINVNVSDINRDFAEKIRLDYIKLRAKEFYKIKASKDEITMMLRICFEGKTVTLCSKDNKKFTNIDQRYRDIIEVFCAHVVKKLPGEGKKTGGWVTSFMSYALKHLEKNSSTKSEVKVKFKDTFKELSAIIESISFSIE
ncbi:MAG: retron Eco8 family effector endonuclease [Eubacterium sp.]